MALLNTAGRYIRLSLDGTYEVYTSEIARNKVKTSTSSETIIAKYRELIIDLEQQEDYSYYDFENFCAEYLPLLDEYYSYCYNLTNYITTQDYPIMAKIYPDVADSIPEIIEVGRIPQTNISLDEAYIKAKQLERFGETTDA